MKINKSLKHSELSESELSVVGIQNTLMHTINELEEADRVLAFILGELLGEGEVSEQGSPIHTGMDARISYMYKISKDLAGRLRHIAIAIDNNFDKPKKASIGNPSMLTMQRRLVKISPKVLNFTFEDIFTLMTVKEFNEATQERPDLLFTWSDEDINSMLLDAEEGDELINTAIDDAEDATLNRFTLPVLEDRK